MSAEVTPFSGQLPIPGLGPDGRVRTLFRVRCTACRWRGNRRINSNRQAPPCPHCGAEVTEDFDA